MLLSIPLAEIDGFPDHPFQVRNDESMQAMAESVKNFGVQTPAIVRQKEDGRYELVSGHRRKKACEIAEVDTMPCIVREMSRDEAIIAMVDSNLQREVILPSEKAKSYKMRYDAMKRQGYRTDLTSRPLGAKLDGTRSDELLAEKTEDSARQIQRYIRLNELIPELLEMVDKQQIAMRPAVELSYLTPEQQHDLLTTIESDECTPSHAQAIKMRKLSDEGRLNMDDIFNIMREAKPNQVENFKIPREKISKFFAADTPADKIEEIIIKALELWRKRAQQRDNTR
jgi:ParB family chromosome partitioning protein